MKYIKNDNEFSKIHLCIFIPDIYKKTPYKITIIIRK